MRQSNKIVEIVKMETVILSIIIKYIKINKILSRKKQWASITQQQRMNGRREINETKYHLLMYRHIDVYKF